MRTEKIAKSATTTKTTKTAVPKTARAAKIKLAKTKPTKPAKAVKIAKTDTVLKAELEPTCEKLRKLFASVDQSDSIGRYEIGALVRDVKANTAYGKRGVRTLAADLEIDASVLYAHATVATVWTTMTAFGKVASQPTKKKNALSFSHLIELAQAADEHREELIGRAIEEDLSVRALKGVIAATNGKRPRAQTISNMFVTPLALAAQRSRWTKALDAIQEMESTPSLAHQLDVAIACNDEARIAWEENGKALTALRRQVAEKLASDRVGTFRKSEQTNGHNATV